MPRNVLIFMTDQQRGATVLAGSRLKAITPNLDRLANEAMTFTRAYTTSPHCCPSRASFFTGLYPSEHGVWNNVNVSSGLSRGPRDGVEFWSSELLDAGFELAFAGKWHVSNETRPADLGWKELFLTQAMPLSRTTPDAQRTQAFREEIETLRTSPPSSPAELRQPGEMLRPGYPQRIHYSVNEDPYRDSEVVDHATRYLEQAPTESPWLLYVGTLGPHDPYMPPQRFLDMYDIDNIALPDNFMDTFEDKPDLYARSRDRFDQLTELEHREAIRHYLAFCSYEDFLFGQLVDQLHATGRYADTAIIYTSDHGDYVGDHGLWAKGLPSFEGAYHIPAVISWPGMSGDRRGIVADPKVSMVDLGPTILDICGVAVPERMSGFSLRPWFFGTSDEEVREELFFQSNGNEIFGMQRIVVTDDWKLVCNFFADDELYDVRNDPGETRNLLGARSTERRLGVGPLDRVPEQLRDLVQDLYSRMWTQALRCGDEVFHNYILTAISTFGPSTIDLSAVPRPSSVEVTHS
ncbi:MAG: sulfatase-like hydrolase/transferase [Rhodoglobus sp.]